MNEWSNSLIYIILLFILNLWFFFKSCIILYYIQTKLFIMLHLFIWRLYSVEELCRFYLCLKFDSSLLLLLCFHNYCYCYYYYYYHDIIMLLLESSKVKYTLVKKKMRVIWLLQLWKRKRKFFFCFFLIRTVASQGQ